MYIFMEPYEKLSQIIIGYFLLSGAIEYLIRVCASVADLQLHFMHETFFAWQSLYKSATHIYMYMYMNIKQFTFHMYIHIQYANE